LVVFLILIGALGYVACGGGSSNSMPTQPVVNTPMPGSTPPPPTPTPY